MLHSFSQTDIFFSSEKEILFSMSFEDANKVSFKDKKETFKKEISFSVPLDPLFALLASGGHVCNNMALF